MLGRDATMLVSVPTALPYVLEDASMLAAMTNAGAWMRQWAQDVPISQASWISLESGS